MSGFLDLAIGRLITVFNYHTCKVGEVFCLLLEFYFGKIMLIGSALGFSVTLMCLLSIMKSSAPG